MTGPDIAARKGRRKRRRVVSQGLGSISVLKPSVNADEIFPNRNREKDYIKMHLHRLKLTRNNPDYAHRVLPSLSKLERAIQYMLPRLKYWEQHSPEAYELLMYQMGTDSQFALASQLAKDMMVNAQSSELLNSLRLRKPNERYPDLQLGLLKDLPRGVGTTRQMGNTSQDTNTGGVAALFRL